MIDTTHPSVSPRTCHRDATRKRRTGVAEEETFPRRFFYGLLFYGVDQNSRTAAPNCRFSPRPFRPSVIGPFDLDDARTSTRKPYRHIAKLFYYSSLMRHVIREPIYRLRDSNETYPVRIDSGNNSDMPCIIDCRISTVSLNPSNGEVKHGYGITSFDVWCQYRYFRAILHHADSNVSPKRGSV